MNSQHSEKSKTSHLTNTESCRVCHRKIPAVPGQEICNRCSAAIPYVTPARKQGRCPICMIETDLYHSPNYYALDWAWCYRDALISTTRFLH